MSGLLYDACRIAGVLTVIEKGLSAREVGSDQLVRALVLVQWYLQEALRIRGAAAVPQSVTDAEMLLDWFKGRNIAAFRSVMILQNRPNPIRNKNRLNAAIKQLTANGYLIENESGTLIDGVRARISWRVCPGVF